MGENFYLEPPEGFSGLRSDVAVEYYHRHLPHWRQEGATYFVTFRLGDSIPQSKLRELKYLREQWAKELGVPQGGEGSGRMDWQSVPSAPALEKLTRMTMARVEHYMDQGMGACVLRQPEIRQLVSDALRHFDGERYELGTFVVMPNHVHLLMRPLVGYPLEKILQSSKRQMSREINRVLKR